MSNLYEWFHDDITWCGNECSNRECERNIVNRLQTGGLISMALFKDTETCPLYEAKDNSSVKQDDVADIMNKINDALEDTEYVAVGYDNTDCWLKVIIDKR